jgi:hypothetical protein
MYQSHLNKTIHKRAKVSENDTAEELKESANESDGRKKNVMSPEERTKYILQS